MSRDKLYIIHVPGTLAYQVCKDEEELSVPYVPESKLAAAEAKLAAFESSPRQCNSGHTTLPLRLWDCPVCTDDLRTRIMRLVEAADSAIKILEKINCDCCESDFFAEQAITALGGRR